jgi:hypothetical protein
MKGDRRRDFSASHVDNAKWREPARCSGRR